MDAANLETAFAGKPAPTGPAAYRRVVVKANPGRSRLAGEDVFIGGAWLNTAFAAVLRSDKAAPASNQARLLS
ncbi:hypothetical protein J2W17_000973 [Pseudomonas lini]|uniref:hypothetical protein n=1 Tax=Pseudomonas lini TaxID=163011 RepID=UPI002789DA4F|nr:hypothetical protein [Pseudomonas lini]MDQ0122028.1 hypothetical protein [Pseudomonas lini]